MDYKNVYKIANEFIKNFINLSKKYKFLEVYCGFLYASKCTSYAVKTFNILNKKDEDVESSITKAVNEDMNKKNNIINLLKPLFEKNKEK